jgi:hypothetical protein
LKLGLGDLHKMSEEQIGGFVELFKSWEGDSILRDIYFNPEAYGVNKEVCDLVVDAIIQILLRKNPSESGLAQPKVD